MREPGLPGGGVADRLTRKLASRAGRVLAEAGRTVAVGESCTGGAVCEALTSIPGSSAYFLGGVVAYGNRSKTRDLGVDPSLLDRYGAVSEEVAVAMADGARRRFGAGVGIGTTGIAGPGGGTPEKPVGTVCLGLSSGEVRLSHRLLLPGDRDAVRRQTVVRALETLLAFLVGGGAPE
jgi:nicotinamide-nucleotide amidase